MMIVYQQAKYSTPAKHYTCPGGQCQGSPECCWRESCGFTYGTIDAMALDIPRIKALCFDVDGTLSDTDDLYVRKVIRFFPNFLFRDPEHTARRFVMWAEAPGNALLGLTDTIGLDDEIVAFIDWT